jgi:ABC-type branched-subunit amino acid transport system ATPase component
MRETTVRENIEISTWTRLTPRSLEERIALAYQVFPGLKMGEMS